MDMTIRFARKKLRTLNTTPLKLPLKKSDNVIYVGENIPYLSISSFLTKNTPLITESHKRVGDLYEEIKYNDSMYGSILQRN